MVKLRNVFLLGREFGKFSGLWAEMSGYKAQTKMVLLAERPEDEQRGREETRPWGSLPLWGTPAGTRLRLVTWLSGDYKQNRERPQG